MKLESCISIKHSDSDPIHVTIRGNDVFIAAYVRFSGGTADVWKRIAEGIEKAWSGQFMVFGMPIRLKTSVIYSGDGQDHLYAKSQKWATIKYQDKNCDSKDAYAVAYVNWFLSLPPSLMWSTSNPGTMYLFSKDHNGKAIGSEGIKLIAAHEFGHWLGIGDAYDTKTGKENPDITSIMNSHFIPVSPSDVEKMLSAFSQNKWQTW